jgi:BirA family biotin operon repressor/biotin-[acetyl-CoA-carboxylase] ligase
MLAITYSYVKNMHPFDSKTKKLLQILSDGNFHTGPILGKALGITRSAVWKLMQRLDMDVEAKTNQGYRLREKIELLDLDQIKAYLSARYHAYLDKTHISDSMPSTNSYLLEQLKEDAVYICLAEMQTAGRGRFHRPWISPFGRNIYLSLRWHFLQDHAQLSGLSIAIAVSILRALKKCGLQETIQIKWPNDLVWQGRKCGGVLIESRGEFHHHCDVVIGVGLNISMPVKLKEAVDFSCTDLSEITGSCVKRNQLVGFLLDALLDGCAVFQEQGLQAFMEEYRAADATFKKPVTLSYQGSTVSGIGQGIDEKGYFLLEDAQGKIQRFLCGEASLRVEGF